MKLMREAYTHEIAGDIAGCMRVLRGFDVKYTIEGFFETADEDVLWFTEPQDISMETKEEDGKTWFVAIHPKDIHKPERSKRTLLVQPLKGDEPGQYQGKVWVSCVF